ncbi:MAG: hypothetical protein BWY31_01564 [Lentisphaerae bacterium ADurb.Bin242]|nr:MAG: hypothetical protein BWY31_01564 [Lentisphaerae bacterium ADurb.Bin242]
MRKATKSIVPEEFWATESGAPLADALHGDGQEALDMLNSVEQALSEAIAKTQDQLISAELKKAREKVMVSMNAYRKAVDILCDKGF